MTNNSKPRTAAWLSSSSNSKVKVLFSDRAERQLGQLRRFKDDKEIEFGHGGGHAFNAYTDGVFKYRCEGEEEEGAGEEGTEGKGDSVECETPNVVIGISNLDSNSNQVGNDRHDYNNKRTTNKTFSQNNTKSNNKNNNNRRPLIDNVQSLKMAIISTLQQDPRSVYRKNKCKDKLYYFFVDDVKVTCWFDEDGDDDEENEKETGDDNNNGKVVAEVLKVKDSLLEDERKRKDEDDVGE